MFNPMKFSAYSFAETSTRKVRRILGVIVSVLILSISVLRSPCAGEFPWKAGDVPPTVAGIVLGDTEARVRHVLGEPATIRKMATGHLLDYPTSGLEVIVTEADGVSVIRLQLPSAGSIDGVKIGDTAQTVLSKWGPPHTGEDRTALFNAGVWTVSLRLAPAEPKIVDILLAWNTTKWPDADFSRGTVYRPN